MLGRAGQIRFVMTAATKRALTAVQDGQVFRYYGHAINDYIMRCENGPPVSPKILWRLLAMKWIEDEPGSGVEMVTPLKTIVRRVRMRLTSQGDEVLDQVTSGAAAANHPK